MIQDRQHRRALLYVVILSGFVAAGCYWYLFWASQSVANTQTSPLPAVQLNLLELF